MMILTCSGSRHLTIGLLQYILTRCIPVKILRSNSVCWHHHVVHEGNFLRVGDVKTVIAVERFARQASVLGHFGWTAVTKLAQYLLVRISIVACSGTVQADVIALFVCCVGLQVVWFGMLFIHYGGNRRRS